MVKKVLTIDEQIEHLIINKGIIFKSEKEKERAKIFFTKHNYLNIISLKYLFASGKKQKANKFSHIYSFKTSYIDIEKKYNEIMKFENKIREGVLLYETELKVHIVMFLREFLKNENIDFKTLVSRLLKYNKKIGKHLAVGIELDAKIGEEWKRNIEEYSSEHNDWSEYYYLLIKILSLGTINKILSYEYRPNTTLYNLLKVYLQKENKFSIGHKFNELDTVGILRNTLCHSENLITFLDKGYRKTKKMALKAKIEGWFLNRDYLVERANSIDFIYSYYMKNKNNKNKKLDRKSWIINFTNYRLKNGQIKMFNKIKINL